MLDSVRSSHKALGGKGHIYFDQLITKKLEYTQNMIHIMYFSIKLELITWFVCTIQEKH